MTDLKTPRFYRLSAYGHLEEHETGELILVSDYRVLLAVAKELAISSNGLIDSALTSNEVMKKQQQQIDEALDIFKRHLADNEAVDSTQCGLIDRMRAFMKQNTPKPKYTPEQIEAIKAFAKYAQICNAEVSIEQFLK